MNDVKLILTDIDGTVLPYGQKAVSERTIASFHAAQAAGIHVGPATGRGFTWVPPFFGNDATCVSTCVATNGSEVFLDGRKIREAHLEVAALRAVAEELRSVSGAGLLTFDGGTPLLCEGAVEDLALVFPAYAKTCRILDTVPVEAPIKANLFFGNLPAAEYEELIVRLHEVVPALDFDIPQPGFANVMPHGSNKATAIDVLADALGIGLDQVVVFGDNGNDVSMLSHVPNSVAVSNASDEARDAARWHVGHCDEDAVAQAIEALAEGVWPFAE